MKSLLEEANNPDKEFFQPEVREGFFISTMMKRFWAAQLKVLGVIDDICARHDIRYYADVGTLLGSVRHGGYIPWDDDLDICMLRDDYNLFLKVAEKELPYGYSITNLYTKEDFDSFNCRINNAKSIECSDERLREYFGCPYIIGIDIFILDGLSDDDEYELLRRSVLDDIAMAVEIIDARISSNRDGTHDEKADYDLDSLLKKIERTHHIKFDAESDIKRQLLLLADKNYSLYPTKYAKNVVKMTKWVAKHNRKFEKKFYTDVIRLPFEYVHIPVPAYYEDVLRLQYGNYMNINKRGGLHEFPLYGSQERKLTQVMGHNPYRYTMPDKIRDVRGRDTYDKICFDMLNVLVNVCTQIKSLTESGNQGDIRKLIEGCLSLTSSLIVHITKKIKATPNEALTAIYNYQYYLSELMNSGNDMDLDYADTLISLTDRMDMEIHKLLSSMKREILFIPCKASWWKTMEPEWRKACAEAANEVYVMPIPYQIRDYYEENEEVIDDSAILEKYTNILSVDDYDIANRHPDRIFIQSPYDDSNTVFRIPEFFRSENLLRYTDELIYIPCFDIEDPIDDDDKIIPAIASLIEQPAVYYADTIILKSKRIKELYIKKLTSITGIDSYTYWNNKIHLSENAYDDNHAKSGEFAENNLLLFRISLSYLLKYGMRGIKKIRSSLDEIRCNEGSIRCIFSINEPLDDIVNLVSDPELITQINGLIDDIRADAHIVYDEEHKFDKYADTAKAYYGCRGNLAHRCHYAGVPVMFMGI